MAESLSKEALLEYVKKQKQKIKKLEQDLSDEKGRAATHQLSSTIPDLSALQEEISGGISAFFGISAASTSNEPTIVRNTDAAGSVQELAVLLAAKDAELTANIQKEKKFKVIIKTKMKEIEEKDKEIKHFQDILATQGASDESKPHEASNAALNLLQQKVDNMSIQLKNAEHEGRETGKENIVVINSLAIAQYKKDLSF